MSKKQDQIYNQHQASDVYAKDLNKKISTVGSNEEKIKSPETKGKATATPKNKGFKFFKMFSSKGAYTNPKPAKTSQETIPYERIFKNGMIESAVGYYTKQYKIKDIDFKVAPDEVQESLFLKYERVLNSFDERTCFQVVLNNFAIDKDKVLKDILIPAREDYDNIRREYNGILNDKLSEGRNNIVNENYFVIGTEAKTPDEAKISFNRIDKEFSNNLKEVVAHPTVPMKAEERIKILHDICNLGRESELSNIDLNSLYMQGESTKDIIAPMGFDFSPFDYFKMGDKVARVLVVKTIGSSLSTEFTESLMSVPFSLTASIFYQPVNQEKAKSDARHALTNVNMNVMEAQKRAIDGKYSPELISADLKETQAQAEDLLKDLTSRNQRFFKTTITIMHYADDIKSLNEDTKTIKSIGDQNSLTIEPLVINQERGFITTLPLGLNSLDIKRGLPTESASLFFPFSTQEILQKGGMYCGLNGVSRNMISINRLSLKNQNGLIFGITGTGKSFTAKREIINVILSTKDDIYVIDPDGEYKKLEPAFSDITQVINLQPGSGIYLNPFDLDIDYAKNDDGSSDDPIVLKSDFIVSICETILKMPATPTMRTIIDRVARRLYMPYLAGLERIRMTDPSISYDRDSAPTLDSFHSELLQEPEPEAMNIAVSLELYTKGSFNLFSQRTNVNTNKRFVIFNLKNTGKLLRELAVQVCLDFVWNKIIYNSKLGKRTWVYIDEFYILTRMPSSALFLQEIFKRARKWGGVITGITQNVIDLLYTVEGLGILGNCDYVVMLSQSQKDRETLIDYYKISDALTEFITDKGVGTGLIYNGSTVIPFVDEFPEDTKLFEIMNTKHKDSEEAV